MGVIRLFRRCPRHFRGFFFCFCLGHLIGLVLLRWQVILTRGKGPLGVFCLSSFLYTSNVFENNKHTRGCLALRRETNFWVGACRGQGPPTQCAEKLQWISEEGPVSQQRGDVLLFRPILLGSFLAPKFPAVFCSVAPSELTAHLCAGMRGCRRRCRCRRQLRQRRQRQSRRYSHPRRRHQARLFNQVGGLLPPTADCGEYTTANHPVLCVLLFLP